jgi:rod shape-determining protein MreD
VSPARLGVVVVGALTLQVTLFARFSFDGARPDVMVLLAVLGGYLLGAERGAIVGFAAGLAFDLLLTTPLGLSALVYALAGYASGTATATMVRASRWVPIAVAAIGSAAAMVVYAMVGALLGQATLAGPPLAAIVGFVAVLNAVLAPLAVRALRWTRTDDTDRRQHHFLR